MCAERQAAPLARAPYVRAHDVDLDVRPLCHEEGLVQIAPVAPDRVLLWIELRGGVADLAEEALAPAPKTPRVVDVHVVVLRINWLAIGGGRTLTSVMRATLR